MGYKAIECKQCKFRIDNEDGTWTCSENPDFGTMNEENAPQYYFSSNYGTGYPNLIVTDCDSIDWIRADND